MFWQPAGRICDLLSSYVGVVLWSGVRLRLIQTYGEQAALDELQDGLVVRVNTY